MGLRSSLAACVSFARSSLVALSVLASFAACGSADEQDAQDLDDASLSEPLRTVDPSKELIITNLSVVEDPVRAVWNGGGNEEAGAWSFGRLMMNIVGTTSHDVAATFVETWLKTWETTFTFNGVTAPARPTIGPIVLDNWPRTASGKLDLGKAPVRLLAIVYRPDLRDLNPPSGQIRQAGEGRFVFGVLDSSGNALPFAINLEYAVPANDAAELRGRMNEWHGMGKLSFGEDFNHHLFKVLTQRFAGLGACPARPNGSCINQIRTNEAALAPPNSDTNNTPLNKLWELREFRLNSTGKLTQAPMPQSPPDSVYGSSALVDFINNNEQAVIARRYTLPTSLISPTTIAPKNDFMPLTGIKNPDARAAFGLTTCGGCHSTETGTKFLHVDTRNPGTESKLSAFLTGTTVTDPATGQARTFNELKFRSNDMLWVLFQATDSQLLQNAPSPQ